MENNNDFFERIKTDKELLIGIIIIVICVISILVLVVIEMLTNNTTVESNITNNVIYDDNKRYNNEENYKYYEEERVINNTTNTTKSDIRYDEQYEVYFGSSVSGTKVNELLNLIYRNNQKTTNQVLINADFTNYSGIKISTRNSNSEDILPSIIINKNYIVKGEYDLGDKFDEWVLKRIVIADESDSSNAEVWEINSIFETYYGGKISGKVVKKLIQRIKEYDVNEYRNGTKRYVRILFHIDSYRSKDHHDHYELTGIGDATITSSSYFEEYIDIINDDMYYYVDSHKFNNDGIISEIVIADLYNASEYYK